MVRLILHHIQLDKDPNDHLIQDTTNIFLKDPLNNDTKGLQEDVRGSGCMIRTTPLFKMDEVTATPVRRFHLYQLVKRADLGSFQALCGVCFYLA
jgi:hypothetical protein